MDVKKYAPILARYGVGIVFFLFGILQLINPQSWVSWLPEFIVNNFDPVTFIYVNGIFDLVIGAFLLVGFLTRIVALLGILHLLGVIFSLGFNDISIRDFGLLLVLVSVLLHGSDEWCLDKKIWK